MKKISTLLFDKMLTEALFEYTKERFISEEEISELKACFIKAAENRVTHESAEDGSVIIELLDF